MKKRHAKSYARERALKANYSTLISKNGYKNLAEEDPLAYKILTEVDKNRKEIDDYISKYLKKWTLKEINPVNLSILEVAIWEMLYDDMDSRIIISEALNFASTYSDPKGKNFIHFVLDKVQGDIKTGNK